MEIIRRDQYRTMPWKNGGGETTEITTSPVGSGLENFDWRLSMAIVNAAGPFSSFPGVDRTLSFLEGKGLDIIVAGNAHTLTGISAPLSFPADVATHATPTGMVVDFNVMTRRARCAHQVERLEIEGVKPFTPECDAIAVFLHRGVASITHAEESAELLSLDTVVLRDKPGLCRLTARVKSTLYLVKLFFAVRQEPGSPRRSST